MGIKIAILVCLLGFAKAGYLAPQVVASPVLAKISEDTIDPNPSYSFAYDVQDAITGDSKGQVESRANGIVQGQYNVAEPDGTRRIVDYTADAINGFNAVVRKTPQVLAEPFIAKSAPLVASPAVGVSAPVLARSAPVFASSLAVAPSAPLLAAPALSRISAPFVAGPSLNYAVYRT